MTQAVRLFHLTSRFNESSYFSEFNSCNKDEICMRIANDIYRPFARLWTPHNSTDCTYDVKLIKAVKQQINIQFKFALRQYHCHTNVTLLGGSTFNAFITDGNSLNTCFVQDQANGQYRIICNIPAQSIYLDPNKNMEEMNIICVNISANLDYEYLDAFSDVQIQMQDKSHYKPYNFAILYGLRFCINDPKVAAGTDIETDIDKLIPEQKIHGGYSYVEFMHEGLQVKSDIDLFSPEWVTTPGNSKVTSNKYSNSILHANPSKNIYTAKYYNNWHTNGSTVAAAPLIRGNYSFQLLKVVQGKRQTCTSTPTTFLVDDLFATRYHFIGTSHIRYLCDLLFENVIGIRLMDKHSLHGSMHYSGSNIYYHESRYAETQANTLLALCQSIQSEAAEQIQSKQSNRFPSWQYKRRHVIFLHTSVWDLSYASLRQFLRNPTAGPRLVCVIDQILNRKIPCGHLTRFVWISSVPYPLCMNNTQCNHSRGSRNNAAIAAANTFLARALSSMVTPQSIRVSFIDAFSVIKPRLALDEAEEVACLNHFLCRLADPLFATQHGIHPPSRPFILFTPGVHALLSLVLHAMNV